MKIHVDTDFGGDVDDACALALAARWPEVEITGVTTVLDEDGRRAGYVQELLRVAGRDGVPVAEGARGDLPRYGGAVFGLPEEARYWPEPVTPMRSGVEEALDLIESSVTAGATVVAIGPFTNLALWEERRPGSLARTDVVLMGGFVRRVPEGFPRFTWRDDFNVQSDVAAARRVLESVDPERCVIVPLEVTAQTWLTQAQLGVLRGAGELGALLAGQGEAHARDAGLGERFGRVCAGLPDDLVNFQHDPLALAVALGWEGATVERVPVRVTEEMADGRSWLRTLEEPGAVLRRVVTAVDAAAFADRWLEVVTGP